VEDDLDDSVPDPPFTCPSSGKRDQGFFPALTGERLCPKCSQRYISGEYAVCSVCSSWVNSSDPAPVPSLIVPCRNSKNQARPLSGRKGGLNDDGIIYVRNNLTGQLLPFSAGCNSKSEYRFQLVCRGMDRLALEYGLVCYFLTITLRNEDREVVNRDLNKFLSFLRARFKKAGLPWYYTWVVGLQKRRYYKSGVKALHWHFAIICAEGALPDVAFVPDARKKYQLKTDGSVVRNADLVKGWGHGQVLCKRAYTGISGYLGKYLGKDYERLDGYKPEWGNLRRFGASQLGYHGYPDWAMAGINKLKAEGMPVDDLYVRRTGATVRVFAEQRYPEWDAENSEACRVPGLVKYRRELAVINSPWRLHELVSTNGDRYKPDGFGGWSFLGFNEGSDIEK
jgi:hypothetical protein